MVWYIGIDKRINICMRVDYAEGFSEVLCDDGVCQDYFMESITQDNLEMQLDNMLN